MHILNQGVETKKYALWFEGATNPWRSNLQNHFDFYLTFECCFSMAVSGQSKLRFDPFGYHLNERPGVSIIYLLLKGLVGLFHYWVENARGFIAQQRCLKCFKSQPTSICRFMRFLCFLLAEKRVHDTCRLTFH